MAAWINTTGLGGDLAQGNIAKRTGYAINSAYTMFLWSSDRLYVDIQSEDNRFASNTVFQNNRWYHVAVVFDGTLPRDLRVRIYVNGVLDIAAREDSTSIEPYTPDLLIGTLPNGGDNFIGRIDEVGVWTRALSAEEIATQFLAANSM